MAADQSLSVGMVARKSNQAEILIQAGEPGAAYAIISPDGSEILSGTIERDGWLAISFPVHGEALYRFQIRANPQFAAHPPLHLRVELLTFANSVGENLSKAEALYSSAETLRNSLHAGDVRDAITKYRQAAGAWESAGGDAARLLAFSAEARAWLDLCEYRKALAVLDRAMALPGAGSGYFRSMLLSQKAEVFLAMWRNESAAGIGAQALRIAHSLKDVELEARAMATVGGAEYFTHAPSAASDLEQAATLATASGNAEILAVVQRYQAWIEEDQGHLAHALALMQQAEDGFRRAGDARSALQTMAYLADIQRHAGDNYAALLQNARLIAPVKASGDQENYANVVGNMGADYLALHRDRDAITYIKRAVRGYESIHHESGLSLFLGASCEVELRLRLLNDALQDCQRAATLASPTHDPKRRAITIWRLGEVRQALGHIQLATENYRRAASISAQVPDPRTESQARIDWGDAVEAAGRPKEALPLFEKAFALSRQAEDPIVELEARFRIARWHANAGEDAAAIRELKVALGQIEARRSAVQNEDLRASYMAAVRKCHQLYVDILMRENQAHPDSASDLAALEISESARARTLLDALTERAEGQIEPASGDRLADRMKLRLAIDQAYERRLTLMLEGGHNRELEENSATLTQAIDSLERMDDAERDEANQAAPVGRSMTAQQIAEASKSTPAALFEYALGATQSYLWVVRNGVIKSYILNARQDDIEKLVKRWRELAATNLPPHGADAELARISAELSCKLIDPFIEPETDKLAIAADGDLAVLPFASLPAHGCAADPGPPLIAAHSAFMIPSLSTFLAPSAPENPKKFAKEVAVFADPVFDAGDERVRADHPDPPAQISVPAPDNKPAGPALARLTGTAEEAAGIEDAVGPGEVSLFLGFRASVDTILSPAMRNYRILHLATHGVLDPSAPGLSGLVLSLVSADGHPVPGYLKIQDIAGLRLSSELVVLSSCDSGAGDTLGGEGATGLAHAFLHAGARRVVSTLWSVDDATTRQLMVDFYREMFSNGAEPGEALRRSQMKMMARPHRSAPYYWAGFEIITIGH